ncbi:MAG TPA: hypothetical protein EYH20_08325 [Leucothrix sp.]|nr:hypothetical protein [Leucothrix sp.]
MEKNTITVTIPFSFKGKEYAPSAIVDLDVYTRTNQDFNFLFHLVATDNKIDRFSYEYEVLESSSILFSQPTGLVAKFLEEGNFDLEGFINARKIIEVQETLQTIASEILQIDKLEENEPINTALLKAYQAGRAGRENIENDA